MADQFVTLYNSETGEAWECPAKAVDYWTKHGFRKTQPSGSAAGNSSSKES